LTENGKVVAMVEHWATDLVELTANKRVAEKVVKLESMKVGLMVDVKVEMMDDSKD
jgi:hypothetical protein